MSERDGDLSTQQLPTRHETLSDPYQANQWHLSNVAGINVEGVWSEFSGHGVVVAVFDDGIEWTHPDLVANVNVDDSTAAGPNGAGGLPVYNDDVHGTAVAGLIAAAHNEIGGTGVAFGATLISIWQDFSASDPGAITAGIQHAAAHADILNNSWGYLYPFVDNFAEAFAIQGAALVDAVAQGRNGLGLIVIQSAGNEGQLGLVTNSHDFASNRYTITVGAIDASGRALPYTTPGASVLVSAPGSLDIITTDRTGAQGYNSVADAGDDDAFGDLDYTGAFGGTSASAAIVSGVVALMLDANPFLGWRDVQEILAYSARHTGTNPGGSAWSFFDNGAENWNGGGLRFSPSLGAGVVDAHAAVRLSETWLDQDTSANEHVVSATAFGGSFPSLIGFVQHTFTIPEPIDVEHVELRIENLSHTYPADLTIELYSPSGTRSVVANGGYVGEFWSVFTFDSVQFWGEQGQGVWTVYLSDVVSIDGGEFGQITLSLFGEASTTDDVYVYTDDFREMVAVDAARATLADDGGIDTINAAAVSSATTIDLGTGTSWVDGRALTLMPDVVENAFAGDGADHLVGSSSSNTLWGGRGDDTVSGNSGDDVLGGGRGNDRLDGGSGSDTADYGNSSSSVHVDLQGGYGSGSDAGTDVFIDVEHATGGSGDDLLAGSSIANTLSGNGGNDVFVRLGESDVLYGGAGSDTVDASDSSASVLIRIDLGTATGPFNVIFTSIEDAVGGAGDDTITGDEHDNVVDGGAGNDTFQGGTGRDTLDYARVAGGIVVRLDDGTATGDGVDTFTGFEDVSATATDDTLVGNDNANLFMPGLGNDVIDGGEGNDTASYAESTAAVVGWLALSVAWGSGIDRLASIEALLGTAADDALLGDDASNGLFGGAGADVVQGGAGNDLQYGGEGQDAVLGQEGDDKADGGFGADYVAGEGGNDLLEGGADADVLDGGSGNDHLYGGPDADYASGQVGDDDLAGGDGADILVGGSGRDSLDGGSGDDQIMAGVGNDRLFGGSGSDLLFGHDGSDTIDGGSDADEILGGNDADVIEGNDGSDSLVGGDGTDMVFGGAGIDRLSGNGGADFLSGDEGDDTVQGGGGNDAVLGAAGNDLLAGNGGDDLVDGGPGHDRAEGGDGADSLAGGYGRDSLLGNASADVLDGNDDPDLLQGGDAHDVLYGGGSDDWLVGDGDSDILYGGAGHDQFMLGNGDTIADFEIGIDAINLGLLGLHGLPSFFGAGGSIDSIPEGLVLSIADSFSATVLGVEIGVFDLARNVDISAVAPVQGSHYAATTGGVVWPPTEASTVIGTDGRDSLFGSSYGDTLVGGLSDDWLAGGDGSDILFGGFGDDTLEAVLVRYEYSAWPSTAPGEDTFYGGLGVDTITFAGAIQPVQVDLRTGDVVAGASMLVFEVEEVIGGAMSNVLLGSDASNRLTAVGELNTIIGGGGDDVLIAGVGISTVDGGSGFDVLQISDGGAETIVVDLSHDMFFGGRVLDVEQFFYLGAADLVAVGNDEDNFFSVAGPGLLRAYGGLGDDTLSGGLANDVLTGDSGIDTADYHQLAGFESTRRIDDTLFVYSDHFGLDTLIDIEHVITFGNFTAGDDAFYGLRVGNSADAGAGNDTLVGGAGSDSLWGGPGDDTISAGPGYSATPTFDRLYGGAGNDTLGTGYLAAVLDGGSGDDVLQGLDGTRFAVGIGNDMILGFRPASQLIDLAHLGYTNFEEFLAAGNQIVMVGNSEVHIIISGSGPAEVSVHMATSGTQFDPSRDIRFTSSSSSSTIYGQSWGEWLIGSDSDDVMLANNGPDYVLGWGGDDTLYGEHNNDTILGNDGEDVLFGDVGDDWLDGGAGNDTIYGDSGWDVLFFDSSRGNVQVHLGAGTVSGDTSTGIDSIYSIDEVRGSHFTDTLSGGASSERFYGGMGDDTIRGGGGSDQIIGASGNDVVYGEDGDDVITLSVLEPYDDAIGDIGYWGTDTAFGGSGTDTLYISGGSRSLFVDYQMGYAAVSYGDSMEGVFFSEIEAVRTDEYTGAITMYGSSGDDFLFGRYVSDTLMGREGQDTLFGHQWSDVLNGGPGNDHMDGGGSYPVGDTFQIEPDGGIDTIFNFAVDYDRIQPVGFGWTSFSDFVADGGRIELQWVSGTGNVVAITFGNSGASLMVIGPANPLDASDFIFG